MTSGLVDVTDRQSGTVAALGAGDAWSSAGVATLAGGMAPIAPPSDVAAGAPPGWRAIDAGVVCFAMPPTWTDQTPDAQRGADGEVLAAWAAPYTTGVMPATTFVSLLAPDDVASELARMAADPTHSIRRDYGAPLAGEPATWREYDVAGEGSLTTVATSPRSDGRILVSIVAVRFDAPPGSETDVEEILGSFTACGGQAPRDAQPVRPPSTPAPVGTTPLGCADTADGGALGSLAIGDGALVSCPAVCSADHAVWGTAVYSDDSSACRAAIHAGAIDAVSDGHFAFIVRGGRDRYAGTARHGVTTRDWGAWHRSFVIDADAMPPGAAAIAPPPKPAEFGGTPDVMIDLPTQRGELSANQTAERHEVTIDRPGDLQVAVQASGDVTIHACHFDTNGTTALHLLNTG